MKLGNDIKGKANGKVILTGDDIDLLLECIRRFLQINDLALRPFSESLESARAIEKQLIFMKKDMQGA